jgi:HK97 family phage major capsid protein
MRTLAVIGAVLAALAIGVCVAQAASPDLLNHAAQQFLADPMLAMSLVPLSLHKQVDGHALWAQPKQLVGVRTRGLIGVRADASDATKIFTELKIAVEAMRAEHEKDLADIKKGLGDVVQSEKVDRINAEITKLQTALDETNALLAAARIGGDGKAGDPDKKAHATAFDQFFRKGAEAGLRELEVKASLRSNSDPDGGYVVPEQMEAGINELLRTTSTVRALAQVLSISAAVYKKLYNRQGAAAGWVGETASRPETAGPTLSMLEFPVFELYANPATTQTLLDDAAISIEDWLASEVNGEFADQEGDAFVNGNGVNKPRGFLQYTNVANASYAWGSIGYIASGAAADFASSNPADKFIDLVHALRAGYRQNARWMMNDLTVAKVRKFKDGTGQYIWQPGITAGAPSTLLAYPLETDDNMPDVNTNTYSVAFADWRRAYLVIDRIGIRVLRDPFTNKPYVHFYTTKRVGGGVQNFEAIKLMKTATS